MNTFLLAALCLLGTGATLAHGVTVPDEEFSSPLESAEKLTGFRELREVEDPGTQTHFDWSVLPSFCDDPEFPEELKPICEEVDAQEIYEKLKAITEELDIELPLPCDNDDCTES